MFRCPCKELINSVRVRWNKEDFRRKGDFIDGHRLQHNFSICLLWSGVLLFLNCSYSLLGGIVKLIIDMFVTLLCPREKGALGVFYVMLISFIVGRVMVKEFFYWVGLDFFFLFHPLFLIFNCLRSLKQSGNKRNSTRCFSTKISAFNNWHAISSHARLDSFKFFVS